MTRTAGSLLEPSVDEAVLDGDGMSDAILARQSELVAIDRFLEEIGRRAAVLVLAGEIGIGKSTLWRGALELARARSYRVLASRPVEAETKLPFSALGDLLETVPDDGFSPLPEPQRQALMAALLRSQAGESRFHQRAVALGVLGTLRTLAADRPVVLAIDDLHWLDQASARVLEFALRRLDAEPVGALASLRTGAGPAAQLDLETAMPDGRARSITLGPLHDEAIDQVLRRQLGTTLLRRDVLRLREVSGGNPYFALELARALTRNDAGGRADEPIPVPQSLRELARDRLTRLPEAVREFALIASALSHPQLDLLVAAAEGPGAELDQLRSAEEAGVLELDGGTVHFTHPLLSSVLYADAPAQRRREVHRRLADLLEEPEERARHLALAIDEPDAAVAAELEQAARLARARGAPESAAELAEQARRLTPRDLREDTARRCIQAADYHIESGNTPQARALLEQALAISPQGPGRARALIPLAWAVVTGQGFRSAAPLFEEASVQAEGDPRVQIESHRGISWCEQHDGDLATAASHARSAAEIAEALGDPALLASSLADLAFLEFLMGEGMAQETMARALELERESTTRLGIMGRPSWINGILLEWSGELGRARTTLEELHRRALEAGDEQAVPFILNHLSRVDLLSGDWPAALRNSDAAYEATLQSAQEIERIFVLTTSALVASCLGSVEHARETAQEALDTAERLHSRPAALEALSVLGFLELSLGRLAEAAQIFDGLGHAVAAAGFGEPGLNFRFGADEIEALVGLGRLEDAETRLALLDGQGRSLDRPWALATAARGRGLLRAARGDVRGALSELDRALDEHERLGEPFELGRTLLVRGITARRDKQKAAARADLERARETFVTLGAELWAGRARDELKRIGGRESDDSGLTPTEERIAELVAEGLSNKEVAAALFVSPKTVEWNLTKIYRKLGVRSRGQLATHVRRGDGP